MENQPTPERDRLAALRTEYANTGMVTSDGAVWLISQVVVLREVVDNLRADLAEEKASHDSRLRCLLVKTSPDQDLYVGWSNVCEMPAGVWSRETALAYGFPPSRLDRADKNGSSDLSCGDGHWKDPGFVAEQLGWLRRDRLGDYAVEYLKGDRQAAYALLEPFEGETEVRRPGDV
ncbi:hypothetical protein [Streptomyces sp. NPDC087856]|uniref:hypothetical protein n=1 Tax=Streptomyces sp. NPDC087856 TaxID=3365811 RepID=UPI0038303F4B